MMIISASIQHWRRMKNKLIPPVVDNDIITNFNPDEGEVGGIKVYIYILNIILYINRILIY